MGRKHHSDLSHSSNFFYMYYSPMPDFRLLILQLTIQIMEMLHVIENSPQMITQTIQNESLLFIQRILSRINPPLPGALFFLCNVRA